MSYAVDFCRATNRGDYCFYLTRTGGHTAVLRQPLKGDNPDPCCLKEMISDKEVPDDLLPSLQILRDGGVPVVT
jgi:hypothetical protein